MTARRLDVVSPALASLWERAAHDVRARRGGPALLHTLLGERPATEVLDALVDARSLWVDEEGDALKGFAAVRSSVLVAVYVAAPWRRQHVAHSLVTAILASEQPPIDAYALPGDRATKSLYESIGWKARLLTMRAG